MARVGVAFAVIVCALVGSASAVQHAVAVDPQGRAAAFPQVLPIGEESPPTISTLRRALVKVQMHQDGSQSSEPDLEATSGHLDMLDEAGPLGNILVKADKPVALLTDASVSTMSELEADACTAPAVTNAEDGACEEGVTIDSGLACTPKCDLGFSPLLDTLLYCTNGLLAPTSFTCAANLDVDVPGALLDGPEEVCIRHCVEADKAYNKADEAFKTAYKCGECVKEWDEINEAYRLAREKAEPKWHARMATALQRLSSARRAPKDTILYGTRHLAYEQAVKRAIEAYNNDINETKKPHDAYTSGWRKAFKATKTALDAAKTRCSRSQECTGESGVVQW